MLTGVCLIVFDWQPGRAQSLVLAANRDEFHDRPAHAMNWWAWPSGPLAGRDVRSGGTWLAVDRQGRFAAVTNYRDLRARPGERSRGELPLRWLQHRAGAATFLAQVVRTRDAFGPFNLLIGDASAVWIVGTHTDPEPVSPGMHALSNHVIDAPWPKSARAARRLQDWLSVRRSDGPGALLDLMDDRAPAPDHVLPDTGIGTDLERRLSAPFVVNPDFGTRSSSALIIGPRRIRVAERRFDAAGRRTGEIFFEYSSDRVVR